MKDKEVSALENFIKMAEDTKPRLPTAYDRSIIGMLIGLAEAARVELQVIKERLERLEWRPELHYVPCGNCVKLGDGSYTCPGASERHQEMHWCYNINDPTRPAADKETSNGN